VGLLGIEVLLPLLVVREEEVVEGRDVYGAKGGKDVGEGWWEGAVLGGCGRWRRRKRVDVGVRKAEMWEEANWSMRLRYLL